MAVKEPIIQLNEEFYPFNTLQTEFPMEEEGDGYATSYILLDIPSLGQFCVDFSASDRDQVNQLTILTPLTPEMGYPLDREDLVAEHRKQKLLRLINTNQVKTIDGVEIEISVYISYEANNENEDFLNLWQTETISWELTETARVFFEHLFIVLTLPNGSSFASRGKGDTHLGWIDFAKFFPTDTGLLPDVAVYYTKHYTYNNSTYTHQVKLGNEGFYLLLPQDRELLKTIKAKFVFLPGVN